MGSHVPKVCSNITRCTKVFHNMYHKMHHNRPQHTTLCTRGGLWDRTIRDGLGSRPSPLPIPTHPPTPFQLQAPHPQVKWSNFFSVSCQPTNPTQLKLNLEWKKTTPHPDPSTAPQARRKSGPMFSSNCCQPTNPAQSKL